MSTVSRSNPAAAPIAAAQAQAVVEGRAIHRAKVIFRRGELLIEERRRIDEPGIQSGDTDRGAIVGRESTCRILPPVLNSQRHGVENQLLPECRGCGKDIVDRPVAIGG
jgi:hypothetical protein